VIKLLGLTICSSEQYKKLDRFAFMANVFAAKLEREMGKERFEAYLGSISPLLDSVAPLK